MLACYACDHGELSSSTSTKPGVHVDSRCRHYFRRYVKWNVEGPGLRYEHQPIYDLISVHHV